MNHKQQLAPSQFEQWGRDLADPIQRIVWIFINLGYTCALLLFASRVISGWRVVSGQVHLDEVFLLVVFTIHFLRSFRRLNVVEKVLAMLVVFAIAGVAR